MFRRASSNRRASRLAHGDSIRERSAQRKPRAGSVRKDDAAERPAAHRKSTSVAGIIGSKTALASTTSFKTSKNAS